MEMRALECLVFKSSFFSFKEAFVSFNSSQSFAPSSSKVLTLSLRALVSLIFSRSFSSSSSIASTLVLHFPCFTISAAISALVLSIALFRLSIVCPEVRTSWS